MEQNGHIANLLYNNLTQQLMQRAARFLSQINVDYEADSQAGDDDGQQRPSDDTLSASRAFHAMRREPDIGSNSQMGWQQFSFPVHTNQYDVV